MKHLLVIFLVTIVLSSCREELHPSAHDVTLSLDIVSANDTNNLERIEIYKIEENDVIEIGELNGGGVRSQYTYFMPGALVNHPEIARYKIRLVLFSDTLTYKMNARLKMDVEEQTKTVSKDSMGHGDEIEVFFNVL